MGEVITVGFAILVAGVERPVGQLALHAKALLEGVDIVVELAVARFIQALAQQQRIAGGVGRVGGGDHHAGEILGRRIHVTHRLRVQLGVGFAVGEEGAGIDRDIVGDVVMGLQVGVDDAAALDQVGIIGGVESAAGGAGSRGDRVAGGAAIERAGRRILEAAEGNGG